MKLSPAKVRRLIAKGESETLELKRSTGELREGMEALCAFLNNRGGTVVFGAAPDGRIVGQTVADNTLHDVTTAVRSIEPAPDVEVSRVEIGGGKGLVVVRARSNDAGPYTYDGRSFIRVGNTTRRMKREEFEQLLLVRLHAKHRWENLPAVGVTIKDLDADEIRRTVDDAVAAKRLAAVPTESPRAILDRLHLLSGQTPTQAAVVLFGKGLEARFPQCAIRVARFRGTTKSEFADNRQFHGHAFDLLRHAEAFLDMHVPIASKIIPGRMRREDRPQYPPEALREALVNAICHRDYSEDGASIGIAIFDDRLEVWSYGRLPGRITPEQLVKNHPSVRRNELIADVFYRRGYIEKWGRGTQKIVELCEAAGARQPEFVEQGGEVGVRFWPAFPLELPAPPAITERQRKILAAIRVGASALTGIVAAAGGGVTERTVQRDLDRLRELGLIRLAGHGRGARYIATEGAGE
ncbi:MAG: ATP-binding protein [Myxococcota bacterium]